MRLSVCIEMLFTQMPLLDRIDAAAAAGADGVEFWGTDGKDVAAICRRARALGLEVATFACGAPLVDPTRAEQARGRILQALDTARNNGIRNVILTTGNALPDRSRAEQEAAVIAALRAVAPAAEAAGVRLNVELLNTLVDHRGYFLDETATAVRIAEAVGAPSVKILYDIYHMQIMEGNLIATIRRHAGQFGYYHAADVPGRLEPGTGEIHYRNVVAAIEETGYDGFLGLEFRPRGGADRSAEAVRAAIAQMRG